MAMSDTARPRAAARDDVEPARGAAAYRLVTAELSHLGVRNVFGLVGEDTVALVSDMAVAGIRYVGTRHEAAAAGSRRLRLGDG